MNLGPSPQLANLSLEMTVISALFSAFFAARPVGERPNSEASGSCQHRTISLRSIHMEVFPKLGYPQSSSILLGFSLKKTIQLLEYPHDYYGNRRKCLDGVAAIDPQSFIVFSVCLVGFPSGSATRCSSGRKLPAIPSRRTLPRATLRVS